MMRARVHTEHDAPEDIAAALRPDNTAEMTTRTAETTITTTIERETLGGLHTTIDDYLINLLVAETTSKGIRSETITTDNNQRETNE